MTAWNTPAPDFRVGLDDGVRGLRVAWSPRLGYVKKLHPEVEAATAKAAQAFAELGAIVEEADPGFAEPYDTIMTIWGGVSAVVVGAVPEQNRARMDPGFLKIAEDGKRVSLGDYLAAYTARQDLAIAMERFHEKYDLLLTPQMPIPALEAGRVTPADGSYGDNWVNWSPYTYPFNLTQQPAASVPCGLSSDGLPIGLQIVGPARADHLVLRAARAFESARPFRSSTPRAIPDPRMFPRRSALATDDFDPFQSGIANRHGGAVGCAQAEGIAACNPRSQQRGNRRIATARKKSLARDLMAKLNINGKVRDVQAEPDTPLLWVIREQVGLTGTKYGCGVAQCGACAVHINGEVQRSCSVPLSAVKASDKIVTIEGLSANSSHPVQKAWASVDVPQCGYCQSGQIMAAAALLKRKPKPTDADIDEAMTNICRCGTYQRIREAVHQAAGNTRAADRATRRS